MITPFRTALLALLALDATVSAAALKERNQGTTTVQAATTAPQQTIVYDWKAGAVSEFPIHSSCNYTERFQLKRGLDDAVALALHAKEHILRFGNSSEFYVRYFGAAPTAEAIGWYDKIVNGNRAEVLFRCDDIDGNCQQPGWGGHWRGENATDETVICPLSYETRKPLEAICGLGYTVITGVLNFYFGSDLIHRLYHMPGIGEETVDHLADTYANCIELAKTSPEDAVRNSHTLQYFALDVYAYDIAVPGDGCTGKAQVTSLASSSAPSATVAPSTSSATTSAVTECHTHSNGDVHCS